MPINSRTKGATFERLIVRKINECFEREGIEDKVSKTLTNHGKVGCEIFITRTLLLNVKDTSNQTLICIAKNGGIKF